MLAGQFCPEVVSLSRRRAVVACPHAAGSAAAGPAKKARSAKSLRAVLICAAALAATLAAPALGAARAQEPTTAQTEVAQRYLEGYAAWRELLERHNVFVGRDLLSDARSAGGGPAREPSEHELRRSIWRMKKRWSRWLRTTGDGRALAFKLKVRRRVPRWGRLSLRSIAACESRNNPRAVGGGGTYRGLYQFSFSTWRVVGGTGDPAAASRWEQTWRAWLLLRRHGSAHWPVCA